MRIYFILAVLFIFSWHVYDAHATTINKANNNDSLNRGLVGYWTFDGKDMTKTTALDKSGQGNTGTLTGGPKVKAGRIGQALEFDGVNDYVRLKQSGTSLNITGDIALSAWIRVSDYDNYFHIIDKNSLSTNHYALIWNGGNIRFDFINGNSLDSSALVANDGGWHDVVFTRAGDNWAFYIDGAFAGGGIDGTALVSSNADVCIGGGVVTACNNYNFDGLIDEVRIYNRALKADEIKRLYNMGAATKINTAPNNNSLTTGLVGYWTFDGKDMTKTTALDKSGNGNTGTLTNGPKPKVGRIGQGLEFDGVDDYVDAGNPTLLQLTGSMSVSAWVKVTGFPGTDDNTIASKTSNAVTGDLGWSFGATKDNGPRQFGLGFSSNGTATAAHRYTNTTIVENIWYHTVGVYNAQTQTLDMYTSGVLDNGTLSGTVPSSQFNSAKNLQIGKRNYNSATDCTGSTHDCWQGLIDEVRIYNRVLKADEIKRLYNMGAATKINTAPNNNSLTKGLVGYWTFDGKDMTKTTALDKSGNGNTGTLTGGPKVKAGRIGQGLEFDGVNDYVDAGQNASLKITGSFTLSAWINASGFPGTDDNDIVRRENAADINCSYALNVTRDNGPQQVYVHASEDGICSPGTTMGQRYSNTTINPNTWYHVAGILNATKRTLDIYINGVIDNGTLIGTIPASVFNSGNDVVIGISNTGFTKNFQGLIDEVRIYNRALKADEIRRLYNMGR